VGKLKNCDPTARNLFFSPCLEGDGMMATDPTDLGFWGNFAFGVTHLSPKR
jgi:hypothetical protein